jgi:hypothetical protein
MCVYLKTSKFLYLKPSRGNTVADYSITDCKIEGLNPVTLFKAQEENGGGNNCKNFLPLSGT